MTITTTWKIDAMECLPQVGGQDNVVHVVHWRLHASEGDATTSVYGSCVIDLSPEGVFTPYEALTEDVVVSWVKASLGEEGVLRAESSVVSALENIITPAIVTNPLPWA